MTLASMMNYDEAALICDFAETYHILDMRSLPVQLAATLCAGLRENSRIRLKLAGVPVPQETLLLAAIADRVEMFRYGFANSKNKKPPALLVEAICKGEKEKTKGVRGFNTVSEFEATLARLKGENNGGD